MVTTSLGYKRAFRSFGSFPNPSSTAQKIRMIISSVVMSDLQYGFSTYIVGFSRDDFNLHHWLDTSKRLLDVVNHVVGIFNADGEAYQVVLHAERETFLCGLFVIAHERGLLDEAFNPTEAGRNVRN